MANPAYMGLAGSLARARKPPAQNDVYMQQPRGTGGGGISMLGGPMGAPKPGMGGMYGGARQQGFGGGFGSGLAGINAAGGFGNAGQAPPMGGMGYQQGVSGLLGATRPPAFGGGPVPGGGVGGFAGAGTVEPFPTFGGGGLPGGNPGGDPSLGGMGGADTLKLPGEPRMMPPQRPMPMFGGGPQGGAKPMPQPMPYGPPKP